MTFILGSTSSAPSSWRSLGRRLVVPVFDQVARLYDLAELQRLGYQANHDHVLHQLSTVGARRIIDVGCGTGILTARLADDLHPESLYGADVSPAMLARARERSREVTWFECGAEDLPIADGSVDAVVSTEAFHFFDQPAALAEFYRVLAPGGHVVVSSFSTRLGAVSSLLTAGGVRFPARRAIRGLMEEAGFEVLDQHQVRRPLSVIPSSLATLARRPVSG